jgi:hypothetical protein
VTRPALVFLATFAFLVAACSSTTNDAAPDGGTRNPDGGMPDGGTPPATLHCEDEGYPCSPAEQTDEGRDLSEQYKAEIQDRLAAGDPYPDIGDWLRGQDGVVDVLAAASRLRFRVDGGSAQWVYSTSPEHPQATLPPFAEASVATKSRSAAETAFRPKRILREDNSDTKVKKKGLILEPFHFQFLSNAPQWKQGLERLHDYDQVTHLTNDTIPDSYFGNWNDYRFVWVLSHGAYLPDVAMPEYTAIFSSKQCGMNRWIAVEVVAGRGTEPLANNDPLASILGLPRNAAEALLTTQQRVRWTSFLDTETEELEQKGQGCGSIMMSNVVLPVVDGQGNPIVRSPAFLDYIYYDDDWFADHYGGGLDNVLLYLSICSSRAVPIYGKTGRPSAIFGWSEPVDSLDDDLATDALFERLITQGEMVEDAFEKVTDAGLHQTTFEMKSTELGYTGLGGGDRARVREIITIIDKDTGDPFPDSGGFLDAREITPQGNTEFDVTVSIVGFGKRDAEDFKVQIFDQNGQELSQEHDVDDPTNGTTVMTIGASVNQEIRSATDIELEARVTLPEESSTVHSKHPIAVTLFPAIEAAWSLNVGGGGTARGEFVFAPFPVGIEDPDGNLFWQVTLAQGDESVVPQATVIIRGHSGRTPECTGQTGIFDAIVTVVFTADPMPTEGFGGGLGGGECGDFVNVEILSFSKEDDLVANVSGIICHWRRVGDEVEVNPVPINGRFQMPQAGCGMAPGGDLLGSYYASEAPSTCFDIYPNAAIAPVFDEACSMGGGLVCSEEPCSTAGQVGQCDYRSEAVSIAFRGLITHFGAGGDWPPVGDLQTGCELQLGTWTTGPPP